jgi:hypothetical protein
VLALDGVPADELVEWLAVARHRAGEPIRRLEPDETLPEPGSFTSGDSTAEEAESEPVAEPIAEPKPVTLPRRARGYDPLAGWSPGRTLG